MHLFLLKKETHGHKRNHHYYFFLFLFIMAVILIRPSITSATETNTQCHSNLNISLKLNMADRTVGDYYALASIAGNADDPDDDDWDLEPVTYTYKKPGTAFILGFFPGFFIHGLGHYYIGKTAVGTRILLVEAASLYMIFAASTAEAFDEKKPKYSDPLKAVGIVLFFGSWVFDFAGAPAKAKKMNEKYGLTVYPEINNDKFVVKLAIDW